MLLFSGIEVYVLSVRQRNHLCVSAHVLGREGWGWGPGGLEVVNK